MNKYYVVRLRAVVWMIILITTLNSCSNKSEIEQLNKDIDEYNIEESFDSLLLETKNLAKAVNMEQEFFATGNRESDYEDFAAELEKPIDEIETDFSTIHNQISAQIDSLSILYQENKSSKRVEELIRFQNEIVSLFTELLDYHYMILETDLIFTLFEKKVIEMIDYMSDGKTTTIEYNEGLELLMVEYEELLNINSLIVENKEYLGNNEDIETVLSSLSYAKSDIKDLRTVTEVDVVMNQIVYDMFGYVEQAVTVMYNYVKISRNTIDEGALLYFETKVSTLR